MRELSAIEDLYAFENALVCLCRGPFVFCRITTVHSMLSWLCDPLRQNCKINREKEFDSFLLAMNNLSDRSVLIDPKHDVHIFYKLRNELYHQIQS